MSSGDSQSKSKVLAAEKINLSHGSGGKDMHDLISKLFVSSFDNEVLNSLEDQARFPLAELAAQGDRLAFTTDSYVVDPIFFPGGDIGMLAVNGTVNDLAVGGARPLYLSAAFILEEGFPIEQLKRIVSSMKEAADRAGVTISTGDTKVVQKGAADKIFINTAGIGVIQPSAKIASRQALEGDVVIVNGSIGEHGAAILASRNDIRVDSSIQSDCLALNHLVQAMLNTGAEIHCLRDATRGGIATVLNELAAASSVHICIEDALIPLQPDVRGLCEILGLDPLYLANEGKLIAIVPESSAEMLLAAMRRTAGGENSRVIGRVCSKREARVTLKTIFGAERILDMLIGEQLPRIC